MQVGKCSTNQHEKHSGHLLQGSCGRDVSIPHLPAKAALEKPSGSCQSASLTKPFGELQLIALTT